MVDRKSGEKSKVRIAKSSKEQDGYEAPDTTGARLSPEAPEGTAGATFKVAPNELAKPALVSRGAQKNFQPIGTKRSGMPGCLSQRRADLGAAVRHHVQLGQARRVPVEVRPDVGVH